MSLLVSTWVTWLKLANNRLSKLKSRRKKLLRLKLSVRHKKPQEEEPKKRLSFHPRKKKSFSALSKLRAKSLKVMISIKRRILSKLLNSITKPLN